MNLDAEQLSSKRIIGKSGGRNVIELVTKGGWHLIVRADASGFQPIGAGSHKGIARFIAKKKDAELELDELSKAESIDDALLEPYIPFWESFTDKLIASSKK